MAFFRKRKRNGKTFYYWVATVPVRQEDGSIGWTKVERGTGTGNLNEAREKAKLFDREYHDKLDRPISEVTPQFIFAEAATLYMKNGGSARYLKPILNEIGLKAVSDIDQGAIQELADKLYPGCQPATINRQIFTPVLAVVNFAAELRKCPPPLLVRPRGHDKVPALEIPSEEWYDAVLPHLTTKMRALVLLLTLHGLRISEAINRKPNELNTKNWTLSVPDTKTGDPIQVRLSGPVIEALKDMQRELQDQDAKRKAKGKEPLARRWLFGTANTATGSIKENNSWKVGGRGGYLVGQEKRVLLFAEGGWQQDETTYSYAVNGKCPSKTCSADLTFSGVFVGGGAEYALNGWSSIGVRYDHFFGSTETLMTGVDVTRDTDQVLFEAKLKLTGSAFGFGSGF